MIGKSDMLSFYGTEKNIMLRAQRTVRNEEDKTLFSLGRSAESFSVSPVSDQLAQPEGASSGTTGLERFHD